jgi:SAM-dependent methyltransferase/FKBP-type peptidyl-prolyl cis-trans isomerase 2
MGNAVTLIDYKATAILDVEVTWPSEVARHAETFYVPLNVWRELDLLPPAIGRGLMGRPAGTRLQASYEPGALVPVYDTAESAQFPRDSFASGQRTPRQGRFYPRAFLTGFAGNPLPFRCADVHGSHFTADFNHPLAGKMLSLAITVQSVTPKRYEKGGECQDWLDQILGNGPGMQARRPGKPTDFFADNPFARDDEQDDVWFYGEPRLVNHLDAQARATIQSLYARMLTPGMKVLDLMSSWQSHLPDQLPLTSVVGVGLNEAELQHNSRLTRHLIHDLNQDPRMPFPDREFDAVICSLSVEYLTRPEEVFQEVARILRPGGRLIHTFSNRWFPPKVIKIWPELHEFERLGLVLEYFLRSGSFGSLETFSCRGWPRPASDRYFPQVRLSDPVYAVWGEIPK